MAVLNEQNQNRVRTHLLGLSEQQPLLLLQLLTQLLLLLLQVSHLLCRKQPEAETEALTLVSHRQ